MKLIYQTAIAVAAAVTFAFAVAAAQSIPSQQGYGAGGGHGPMMGGGMGHGMSYDTAGHGPMRGPVAMLTRQDANSSADMAIVMNLVHNNTGIRRVVTNLPDGIRTVTESDDPKVAADIKAHVASMSGRLKDGREFNLFSTTLPVIFDNAAKIKSSLEFSDKGVIVTRTSSDQKIVAALQAHAGEVSELVRDGMAGMRRGMKSRMAMGSAGPRGATGAPARAGEGATQHQH